MRIACPDCNAVYELPPERVRPGRAAKCAKCGTVWVPVALVDAEPEIRPMPEPVRPPEPEPEPPPPPPVELPPLEPPPPAAPEPSAPRAARWPVLLGWVLTVLVLAALAWAAVAKKDAVMHAWPASERAYGWMGLR